MKKRQAFVVPVLAVVLAVAPAAGAGATSIGWGNLQWPFSYTATSCTGPLVYGQVWLPGVTDSPGQGAGISAQLGFGPVGSTPDGTWLWIDAQYNVDAGNNDEYMVGMTYYLDAGSYDYTYRYQAAGDSDWYVAAERGTATITEGCGQVADERPSWGLMKATFR